MGDDLNVSEQFPDLSAVMTADNSAITFPADADPGQGSLPVTDDARGDGFPDAVGSSSGPYVVPGANGPRGTSTPQPLESASDWIKNIGDSAKATSDSLLRIYSGWNQADLALKQAGLARENQKLSTAVAKAQMDGQAQIAQAQALRDIAVAKAQAQQAVNAAQIAAKNARGIHVFGLPINKAATVAICAAAAFYIYKRKAA